MKQHAIKQRALSTGIFVMTTLIGLVAFLYPFWLPMVRQSSITGQAHAQDSPLMLTLLVGVCFVVLLLEVQGQATSAKLIALLGMLIAINSILRFMEAAFPLPGGFSPIFFLIVATGYIFGPRFGFLMGALTMLVSSLITGLMGPWLPYQMFTAGWVGMSAPLCRPTVWMLNGRGNWREVWVLALFGGFWGLVYGLIINLWFWPFATGPASQYWEPGIALLEIFQRYAMFYITTSLVWDVARSIGNIILTLTLGLPTLAALRRFQARFTFEYQSLLSPTPSPSVRGES
jgi:energy-coupling factor transport system substrate-specific component